ncbi:hypothetical protein J3Q00_07620 [Pseudomonas sp. D2-3]
MDKAVEYVVWMIPEPNSGWADWAAVLIATLTLVATVAIAVRSLNASTEALKLSRLQAEHSMEHSRLMVRPHLDGANNLDIYSNTYSYEITNNGIGPAVIKAATFYVDGVEIVSENPLLHALALLIPDIKPEHFGHETVPADSYVSVGQKISLITVLSHEHGSANHVHEIFKSRARLVVEYTSIYNEVFTFDSSA